MSEDIDSPDYVGPKNWIVTVQRTVTYTETSSVTVNADSAEEAEEIVSGWRWRDFDGADWDCDDNHDYGMPEVVEGHTEPADS